jgi:hypothetical protein
MGMLRTLRSVARLKRPEFNRTTRRLAIAANVDGLRTMAKKRLPGGVFDHMLDLMRSGMECTMARVGSATVDDLDPELVRLRG